MLKVLYALSEEVDFILGIISLLIGLFAWFCPSNKKFTVFKKKYITIVCFLITAALAMNHVSMMQYTRVPHVEQLEYAFAQNRLQEVGLRAVPLSVSKTAMGRDIVGTQEVPNGSIIEIGEEVTLYLIPTVERVIMSDENVNSADERENTTQSIPPQDTQPTPSQNPFSASQNPFSEEVPSETSSSSMLPSNAQESQIEYEGDLSIIIDTWEVFFDGFYYQEPEPGKEDAYWFIDFDKGVSGTFHYSRPLSDQELLDWGHGGRLYDGDRNEIGKESNYPSFWSDEQGYFAMQFPSGLESGTYIYELYQFIGDQFISTEITFSI